MLIRFVMLSFLSLSACGDALFKCTATTLETCDEVQTCCDSTECFFEVDEKEFRCDGKKCDEATARLREYCADSP